MVKRVLKDYQNIALNLEDLKGTFVFEKLFANKGPVHVEIGSGKATFLLNEARGRPEVNFIGIEWARKYYRYSVDRVGRWGLDNVRIIRTDAAVLIADFIADGSVDCFHIYFPDPWPKRRHHKRRFINQTNLEQMLRCLKQAGSIRMATDHADYFQAVGELVSANKDRVEKIDFFPAAGADIGEWVGTNFERKYLKQGRDIHTLAVRKIR
jgi:tRNA (guanine-N7-)-methyltransferase